jgi:hypothetical protein
MAGLLGSGGDVDAALGHWRGVHDAAPPPALEHRLHAHQRALRHLASALDVGWPGLQPHHVGLLQLEAGGDFADAIIAHEGQWLGGDTFLSFDRHAVALLREQGIAAELLR